MELSISEVVSIIAIVIGLATVFVNALDWLSRHR